MQVSVVREHDVSLAIIIEERGDAPGGLGGRHWWASRQWHPGPPTVRFSRHIVISFVLAATLLGTACRRPPAIGVDVVVNIDGEELHYSGFEDYLRRNVDRADVALDGGVQSQLFDRFMDEQLLIRLAIERGLVEPGVDHRRAVEYLLRADPPRQWTEAELQAYYAAHRADYEHPEEVFVRQILAKERAIVEEARQAIDRGEDFAQVAARLSEEPKAHLGGDQGWLGRDDLPAGFADVIFDLEAGEVSDVVSADYGHLLFQVVERHPLEQTPFEEVAGEIRQALERRYTDERVAGLVEEARERYNVKIFTTNFPFEYRGDYVHREAQTDSQ